MTQAPKLPLDFGTQNPYLAIGLTTLILIIALGVAGTALYMLGQQQSSAEIAQQVQPVLLVFPFFALWLGILFFARHQWALVSPRAMRDFGLPQWALFLLPALVVIVNILNMQPSVQRSPGQIAYFLGFALLVGFVEEGLYRGLFITWLLPRGINTAILVSTLIFAATHAINLLGGQSPTTTVLQILFAVLFGLVAALLRLKAGSLVPLILWHALFDSVGFLGTRPQDNLALLTLNCVLLAGYAAWLYRQLSTDSEHIAS